MTLDLCVRLMQAAEKSARGRTLAECAPGGERTWGRFEATWDGTKWVGVAPISIVYLTLEIMAEDYIVEIAAPWGTLEAWASDINPALVTG